MRNEDYEDDFSDELSEKVDAAANAIMAKIDPDRIRKEFLDGLGDNSRASSLLGKEYTKKDIASLTGKEKAVLFAQAVLRGDHTVLKGLSESSSVEGGYLVPSEFANMIIRDLADKQSIINETGTIEMHRNVMKIPGLVDGLNFNPLRW